MGLRAKCRFPLSENALTIRQGSFDSRLSASSTTWDSRDLDGDGHTDQIETFTAQYDNQDRQIVVTDSFTDTTGALLFSATITTVYGKNTSTATEEIDSDGDGTIDRRVVTISPL